ncbi:hypothetical protein GGQ99_005160 [Aminobacter niigataensis]|uniref:RecF/RecN/SMC N-terminal domain-containing protein n=1 Tax=Aminobacter niigataensis TaxID=83265 RepID=A0ABR6LAW0_9HYPH|nr:AAA family ATPase [Aminobacter niigataensis]MBB4653369.1 hypothetical protein [Aminobacter niigataensis]
MRIRALTVKGFRAYGAAEQTLNLPGEIAAVWGPNSKGKTSLGEAFEFLLTGSITRRELMASSQDEFADALRNAHLAAGQDVFVAARITAPDGTDHEIKRVLTADYAKRQDCTSRLEIDGAEAAEADLAGLGIVLSQPPLQAPVLAQHTLSYIFSVRPQDRATYFKALFEVTDLDELRNVIAVLADELTPPDNDALSKFDSCAALALLQPVLAKISRTIPDLSGLAEKLNECARALLESAGANVPGMPAERLAAVEKLLADLRSKTFPVRGFERTQLAGWNPPAGVTWTQLETYIEEREKVSEETRRLVALFNEALKLPAVADIEEPVDCLLCGAEAALTPARVQLIRQHAADTKDFKAAETAAKTAFSQLSTSAHNLIEAVQAALPEFFKVKAEKRRKQGFTISRIRQLLDDDAAAVVEPWLARIRPLVRAGAALRRQAEAAQALVEKQTVEIGAAFDPDELTALFAELVKLRMVYAAALDAYDGPSQALVIALNEVLDAQSDTAGWQNFLDIAPDPTGLRTLLIERLTRATVTKELEAALKQIDTAKEKVLEDKFSDYSGAIQAWWERLRPDEPTFFSAVQPRKGAKRTIDFKAGLSASADRAAPKLRDVIAIFSQSQLHCLGLSLFLARAEHEGAGFIVLDDPVLSSDEDYRVHFNSTVLTELLALPMQVIVLTQDHDTWEELETRYRHSGISTAQLYIDTPAEGTVIENTSDALVAKLNRAKSLARGGHPDSRKECGVQLRDAGERFCKEILVNDRRKKGDTAASLTDYDGKTMEWLLPHVEPLLDRDPSHPGKFTVFKQTANDACHDNTPPSTAAMTQAHGEIWYLVKVYLPR